MNKNQIKIMSISAAPGHGFNVEYAIVTPEEQIRTMGSFNIGPSHPQVMTKVQEMLVDTIKEILENGGYLSSANLVQVKKPLIQP